MDPLRQIRFPIGITQNPEALQRELTAVGEDLENLLDADRGLKAGDYRLPITVRPDFAEVTPSTAARVYSWPFHVATLSTIDLVRFRLVIPQAGAEMKVGIYSSVGNRPNVLLADLGTVALSGAAGNVDIATNQQIDGAFWLSIFLKNVATQATLRGPASNGLSLGGLPAEADVLVNGVSGCLSVAEAYPAGGLPDLSPDLTPFIGLLVPVPVIRGA
jgi:hypothetical protein